MCLITTCAVGLCLIWRISVPFTPLRRALFAFVAAGLAVGVTVFPGFFSIARPTIWASLLTAVFSLAGCAIFYRLADAMELSSAHSGRLATGFGRGVRVSLRGGRRSRSSRVDSTGSSARRAIEAARTRMERRATARELARAEEHAQEGALGAEDRTARPDGARRVGVEPAGKREDVRKKRYRVEQAHGGIRVKMPKTTRKKDQ